MITFYVETCDAAKAMLCGKCIALNTHIRKVQNERTHCLTPEVKKTTCDTKEGRGRRCHKQEPQVIKQIKATMDEINSTGLSSLTSSLKGTILYPD